MKILVVDDIEANRYLLRTLLQSRGHQVAEAGDGAQALAQARQGPPDLVVSDILMPVMDGFALCHEWKQDAVLKHIPFVFYTATYTDHKDRELALSLGADAFYIKPMEGHDFLHRILQLVDRRDRGDEGVQSPGIEGEEPYYRQYNARLVRKLEDKMLALEQSNEALRQLNNRLERRVEERTADLRAINQELESFAYSVSHDLRAPLRVVDGFGLALEEEYGELLDETGRDYLMRLRRGSRQMNRLIDDLLSLSRISRRELRHVEVDLSALAASVFQEISAADPARRVRFSIQPGLRALADEGLMRVVLQNLLGNAWKFTGQTVDADIHFGRLEFDGRPAFYVSDNGVGFDMGYADKLFSPFQRLHAVEDFEGSGIGLATVQRVISRHGGRVWTNATPDRGATFYFTLGRH